MMGGNAQTQASGPSSISLKRKATTDVIVIEDDPMTTENDSPNFEGETSIKPTAPHKSEQNGSEGSRKSTASLAQPSKQRLPSEDAYEDILIERQDEPAPKRRKLERRLGTASEDSVRIGFTLRFFNNSDARIIER
ncbi:hypothetical protein M413DRAFT_281942 [Hebeloma cylindrosporum]|uniref:Uncharacterized protein n=1 Tax=Hebeloma cylindrosporum TaxID=76867 RepID=A0A0C3BXV9_HEBCY|nr:hypothetical protein M413DRAFT_281942 [Hebeloma cylindrosporum h7]